MLVGYGIKEPLDVFFRTYNARQSEDFNWGIIGVYAHIHIALLTGRHDGLQEVFHVGTQLSLVDALVEIKELAELLDRSFVILAEVTGDESLRLDDDVFHQFMVFLWCHGLGQFIAFGQHIAAFAPSFGELKLCPLFACAFALQNVDVKICKLGIIEVQVGGSVWIVVEQIRACPVEHGHEVVANAVDTFS